MTVRVVINDGPDRLTVTPGTMAFVLSVTTPLTAPVVAVTVCASAVRPAHGDDAQNQTDDPSSRQQRIAHASCH